MDPVLSVFFRIPQSGASRTAAGEPCTGDASQISLFMEVLGRLLAQGLLPDSPGNITHPGHFAGLSDVSGEKEGGGEKRGQLAAKGEETAEQQLQPDLPSGRIIYLNSIVIPLQDVFCPAPLPGSTGITAPAGKAAGWPPGGIFLAGNVPDSTMVVDQNSSLAEGSILLPDGVFKDGMGCQAGIKQEKMTAQEGDGYPSPEELFTSFKKLPDGGEAVSDETTTAGLPQTRVSSSGGPVPGGDPPHHLINRVELWQELDAAREGGTAKVQEDSPLNVPVKKPEAVADRIFPRAPDNLQHAPVENRMPVPGGEQVGETGSEDLTLQKIVSQIVEKAHLFLGKNQAAIRLQLKPEFLGHLDLTISVEKGLVHAHFVAENSAVAGLIEGRLQELRQSLEQQGISWQQLSVSVESQSGSQGFSYPGSGAERSPDYGSPFYQGLITPGLGFDETEEAEAVLHKNMGMVDYLV